MTVVTITAPGTGSITVGGGGANDPPSGVTSIQVECWGNGASSPSTAAAEAGGPSGAYARTNAVPVVNGSVLNYTVTAGRISGDISSSSITVVTLNGLTNKCVAEGASTPSNLNNPGTVAGSLGDVVFAGAAGVAAQSGGGSRGGGGGSSSAGPLGAGVAGSPGVSSAGGTGAASATDVGGGGNGAAGAVAVNGSPGVSPGGGGGGGGSGSSNGGKGGDGQIRFTWTGGGVTNTLLGQACL